MNLISDQDNNDFKALFGMDAADTFAQQTIIWRRQTTNIDRWKEDNNSGITTDVALKCLINYNYMRSWPISNMKEAGETEEQSIQVLFNKAYLQSLGYLDQYGKFDYQADYDRFIVDGTIRKPMGDTSVSQAFDTSLWYVVIMVEQRTPTGTDRG